MCDASFKAYAGKAGYIRASGGGFLMPNDFSGLPSILTGRSHGSRDNQKMYAAIQELRKTNQLIIANTPRGPRGQIL